LLVLDPDLGGRMAAAELARAQRELLLLGVELPRGILDPTELAYRDEVRGLPFGAVVLEGVIVERMELEARPCARLVGPGDLLGLGRTGQLPLAVDISLEVLQSAFVAVLDDRFIAATQRWPALSGSILDRAINRGHEALMKRAIAQLPRVEDRLLYLFRSLADRWGRVRPEGIVIELALTHDLIGELIGARRPTVTLGLRALAETGELRLLRGEGWLLTREGPAEAPTAVPPPRGRTLRAVLPDVLVSIGAGQALEDDLGAEFAAVRRAVDGPTALAALDEPDGPAVVLIDVTSPGIGERAVEIVERMRQHGASRMVLLTSVDSTTSAPGIALLDAAAHDRLPRDGDPQQISAAVREQLAIFRAHQV
jgi:CRP/FNR family cyclic AMP-dependent transcriptional regulator